MRSRWPRLSPVNAQSNSRSRPCCRTSCASLDAQPRLVLEAPPGAGKTTQVPLALLRAGWRGGGRILMLEPRRVAARAAAGFMAAQLGEAVGETRRLSHPLREQGLGARPGSKC